MNDLRTAAQQALEFCEFLWREVVLNDWAEGQRGATEAALHAALAEPPTNQCGETCERAKLCAVCARGLADGDKLSPGEPVQEPVAWTPIEQPYPQGSELDILMGDGSILCSVLPQYDGDLWWEGSGTGEKFIDPKYVTHWRIHSEHTAPPQRKPLTDEEIDNCWYESGGLSLTFARAIEQAHGIKSTGCDHCTHPLYAAIKCKRCGRVTE